jgi:hypothetical protein
MEKKSEDHESKKAWAVTYYEYGDSVDGKARVLGLFESEDAARDAMYRHAVEYKSGCEYNMEEVCLP